LTGTRRNFLKICHEEMPRLLGASGVKPWRKAQENIPVERAAEP
jgi:hypothetical protein